MKFQNHVRKEAFGIEAFFTRLAFSMASFSSTSSAHSHLLFQRFATPMGEAFIKLHGIEKMKTFAPNGSPECERLQALLNTTACDRFRVSFLST
jgi:hypothetical protein